LYTQTGCRCLWYMRTAYWKPKATSETQNMQYLLLFHLDIACKIRPHFNAIIILAVMLKVSCLGTWRFNWGNKHFIQVAIIFSGLIGCLCLIYCNPQCVQLPWKHCVTHLLRACCLPDVRLPFEILLRVHRKRSIELGDTVGLTV
jgi:hypothetical protein